MSNENKLIVRLKTSCWHERRGLYQTRSITYLKKKSGPNNLLEEDADMIGADEVFRYITNLNTCADGIYQVLICNERRDYETGMIDDYDYKLIPYIQ